MRLPTPVQHTRQLKCRTSFPCHCKVKTLPLHYQDTEPLSQISTLPVSFSHFKGTGPSSLHLLRIVFASTAYFCSLIYAELKKKGEFFLKRCSYGRQDLVHLLLNCRASERIRRAIFGATFSIFVL